MRQRHRGDASPAIFGQPQTKYLTFPAKLSSFCRRVVPVNGAAVNVVGKMNTMNSPAGVVVRQQLSTTPERVKRQAQNVDLGILAS